MVSETIKASQCRSNERLKSRLSRGGLSVSAILASGYADGRETSDVRHRRSKGMRRSKAHLICKQVSSGLTIVYLQLLVKLASALMRCPLDS